MLSSSTTQARGQHAPAQVPIQCHPLGLIGLPAEEEEEEEEEEKEEEQKQGGGGGGGLTCGMMAMEFLSWASPNLATSTPSMKMPPWSSSINRKMVLMTDVFPAPAAYHLLLPH